MAVLFGFAQAAFAQSQGDSGAPPGQLPTASPPTTQGGDTQSQSAAAPEAASSESAKFQQLNKLVLKGWATPVPTFDDTITLDYGGWRSTLASYGLGFTFFSLNLLDEDLAQAGKGLTGTQLYNGQKLTYQTGNQTPVLTYDLGHLSNSLAGGQIIAIGAITENGYAARDGIRGERLKSLYWYQPILGGKVELEGGIISNATDYMGTSVGGSLSGGALGPMASIQSEVGESYGNYGAPTISARINWTKHFYTRTAIQRSISPKGSTTEEDNDTSGFNFGSPHADPLIIQEVGYRVTAAPGIKAFWARTDGIYNTSGYTSYTDKMVHNNYMGFVAVDKQLTQPNPKRPASGLYLGGTYTAAPGSLDLINRYYEARAYYRGPFYSRPYDMISFVAAVNGYGSEGRVATMISGFTPYSTTQTYTAAYSYRIMHGLYLNPGLGIVVNPVYNRNIGTVVNALLNLAAFF
ncbi:MAG: carbohydrate porin [Caulobacteraceae bacterium]